MKNSISINQAIRRKQPITEANALPVGEFFDRLNYLSLIADQSDFERVFGLMGQHIWIKFQGEDYDLVRLYAHVDRETKTKLEQFVLNGRVGVKRG
ncbi:hypothetical protein QUF64_03625 [Anaerolineales bacterium HSG6]|nr:hypothetical protein [Anaerolineales bacterium HSG6]